MLSRPLGQSGIEASVIGIGTWAIGGTGWGGTDGKAAVRAIQGALDLGITLIDTAPVYGRGLAEELLGKALKGRRHKAVLATKCGLHWDLSESDSPNRESLRGGNFYRSLRPSKIRREVENSLRRLQTETIDLYQTHWPDSATPIAETMAVLLKLKEEGKIRSIGVANVTPAQLREYLRWGPIGSDQELFNMLDRDSAKSLFPLCTEQRVARLAYSPLAMGLLSGKVEATRRFSRRDLRRTSKRFSLENRQKVQRLLARLQPSAERHGLTLAQLVIAWTKEQPSITHLLCGVRNPQQTEENARAGEVLLSHSEINAINQILDEENIQLPPLFGT